MFNHSRLFQRNLIEVVYRITIWLTLKWQGYRMRTGLSYVLSWCISDLDPCGSSVRWLESGNKTTNAFVYLFTSFPSEQNGRLFADFISDTFSWMIFLFWLKFHWYLLLRVHLKITQSVNCLASNRRQAIILSIADPIYLRIYAALREMT